MATSTSQAGKGLQWFQKPLTIKINEGLPERIFSFVEKCTEAKPTNGKELLVALLQTAETQASVGNLQEINEELTGKLEVATAKIEELEGKLPELEQGKEETQKETERLLAENETLKEENERLKMFETTINEFVTSLQAKLPEVLRENDNSPAQSVDRIVFLIQELRTQIADAETKKEEAEAALQMEKIKPAQLKPGQAIVGFPPKQQEEIRMLRMLYEKMGHQFKTTNVEEVVHHAVSSQIETSRFMVGLCKDYAPLLTILNPSQP